MIKYLAMLLLISSSAFSRDLKCYRTAVGVVDTRKLEDSRRRLSEAKGCPGVAAANPFELGTDSLADIKIAEPKYVFSNIGPGLPSSKKPMISGDLKLKREAPST